MDVRNPAPPLVLVFWKCLVDNKDISANPRARNPPKSIGNLKKSIGWGGRGGWGMDFYRFPVDLGGFLACGFAFISLLSTKHYRTCGSLIIPSPVAHTTCTCV